MGANRNTKHTVTLRNLIIGEGKPKICVPIVGTTKEEILLAAMEATKQKAEIIEWRVDFYNKVEELQCVIATLSSLRSKLGELPLLFTFRSNKEGGERTIDSSYYRELNIEVAKTGFADLIDLELFSDRVEELIGQVHSFDTKVIISNHDFIKTPENEEILSRLKNMCVLGGDIAKIAVMPTSIEDVLRLLSVTRECQQNDINCPIVTMSMSEKGLISRLTGEIFGSALTFGAVGKISAPGQIPIEELDTVLGIIHTYMK